VCQRPRGLLHFLGRRHISKGVRVKVAARLSQLGSVSNTQVQETRAASSEQVLGLVFFACKVRGVVFGCSGWRVDNLGSPGRNRGE
jgi:hypothetical protein